MSISAPSPRRWWLPTAAAVAALVAAAGVAFYLNADRASSGLSSTGEVPTVAAPGIEQADWAIRARSAGGQPSNADRKLINARGPEVVDLVKSVYNAMFLKPAGLNEVVASNFTSGAARAFKDARTGLPANATEVQIRSRSAEIGISLEGASHAAATVRIVAAGLSGENEWSLVHRSTLWLERKDGKWRVIGFELTREPRK